MRIASARFVDFKGFADLHIEVPESARLVVMSGPNGFGKSSVFDGFRTWQGQTFGLQWDPQYHGRAGSAGQYTPVSAQVSFHGVAPSDQEAVARALYFRTAQRFEPEFNVSGVGQQSALVGPPRIAKMTDTDAVVSQNYQRMMESAVRALFDESRDQTTSALRAELIADLSTATRNIFPNLELQNLSDPLQGGSFFFRKNGGERWNYKNLSGGERAAFDLLLDVCVKRAGYDDTVYCIDEPELHLNTRVQGGLLRELLRLLPSPCQLWVSTHSIGMMREAMAISRETGAVAFLDFEGLDARNPSALSPIDPNREFWRKTLKVALDDLSELMAPEVLVLVEGEPYWAGGRRESRKAFDAKVFSRIFRQTRPEVEFLSVGGSDVVESDGLQLTNTAAILTPGTKVLRVVDRDERSDDELQASDEELRILSLRDIENYLLADDVLAKLCASRERENLVPQVLAEKRRLLESENQSRGRAMDDVKNIAGAVIQWLRRELGITGGGNDVNAFLLSTLCPLIEPGVQTFDTLQADIFAGLEGGTCSSPAGAERA